MGRKLARNKARTTLILLGVFLILLASVYIFEIKGVAQREKREKSSKQFFPIEQKEVSKLTLVTEKDSIVCERQTKGWKILHPIVTDGDSAMINSYLSSILEAKIERKVLDTLDDPEAYGLQTPRGRIYITGKNNKTYALLIGDDTPTSEGIFVKVPEKPNLYTTNSWLWSYASKTLYDLRDKKTMHINVDEVRKIEVFTRKKGEVVLEKTGDNWQIIKPIEIAANNSEVISLLNRLANGRVKNFISEEFKDLPKYGFKNPQIKIVTYSGEGYARSSFTVGDTAKDDGGGFYAYEENRSPVFTIENWAKESLIKGPFDLQDKKLLHAESDNIDRIVWRIEGKDCAAIRVDTLHWLIVAPETLQVDDGAMRRFISAIKDFTADDLETYSPKDLNSYGFNKPYLRLTIFAKDKQLGTILVGNPTKNDYFVKNLEKDFVYRVRKYNVEKIAKKPDDLKRIEPSSK